VGTLEKDTLKIGIWTVKPIWLLTAPTKRLLWMH